MLAPARCTLAKTPAFLLIAPDRERRAEWTELLERHAEVRAFSDFSKGEREALSGRRRFLALVVDVDEDEDGRSTHRLLTRLRRAAPGAPGLLTSSAHPRSLDSLRDLGFRHLPSAAPAAEARYFVGHCLAREVTGNAHVAAAVEALGRERSLTPKQMELTAIATLDMDRDALAEGLGVSGNTLKTRVRQLLRVHREETMDTLGKTVLRRALELATATPWGARPGGAKTAGPRGALPSERGAERRPAPPKKRKRKHGRKRKR